MNHTSSTAVDRRPTRGRAGAVLGVTALVAAAALVATAPARAEPLASPTQAHTVDITGSDYQFAIDTHGAVPAGLVQLNFTDSGPAAHQAQLFRLNDGVTFAKFVADLATDRATATSVDSLSAGGVGDLAAPGERSIYQAMQGGTYAVISMVTDSNNTPDFAKGMVAQFTVTGHLTPQQLAALHPAGPVAGVVTANTLSYSVPPVLAAGALYRYQDADTQSVHEFLVGRLLPGVTAADAKAWFATLTAPGGPSGPQPFVDAGGYGGVAPGTGGWFCVNMEPGNYVAFDLAPNITTGAPNATLGMVTGFTVA